MEGACTMNISSNWRSEIRQHPDLLKQHQRLFEQKTPLCESVLDRITFVTNRPITKRTCELLNKFGIYHRYCGHRSLYTKCYKLGCVTILVEPRFWRTPATMVVINPSNAGLTFGQVMKWIIFLFGTHKDVFVSRVDYKVDLIGVDTKNVIRQIWCSRFRKFEDEKYQGQTLYIGTRQSKRQRIIYDKGRQTGNRKVLWTRIEIRERYERKDGMSVSRFLKFFKTYNPFDEVFLLDLQSNVLLRKLKKHNSSLVLSGIAIVIRTLKQLTAKQRKRILTEMEKEGTLICLDSEYCLQLKKWLQH